MNRIARTPSCSSAPRGLLWRCGNYLLILALLGATGGHWAVLQTIAWSGMLIENLQADAWQTAVAKTFDGEHPCHLCHQIKAGKKAEKKAPLPELEKKLKLFCEAQKFNLIAPADFTLLCWVNLSCCYHPLRPPKPPPRVA